MVCFITLTHENLTDPDVLNATNEKRVLMVVNDEQYFLRKIVDKVMPILRKCESLMSVKCNMRYVRECMNALTGTYFDDFEYCLNSEDRRMKFFCHILGSFLQHGVFKCSASDLARAVCNQNHHRENLRRYINEGRKREDFLIIFRKLDDAIPNYPT